MTVRFLLAGQEFVALNGGPQFSFTPAISFVVNCETQAVVDALWEKLSAGGEEGRCGWLQDQFGVSWQIVPTTLVALLNSTDASAAQRVMLAMMTMKKIDISLLQQAYRNAWLGPGRGSRVYRRPVDAR